MERSSRLLFLILTLAASLACRAAARLVSGPEPTPSQAAQVTLTVIAPTSQATEGMSCPEETSSILKEANVESLPGDKFPSVDTGNNLDVPLVTYTVNGDQLEQPVVAAVPDSLLKYQRDVSTQQSAWHLFTELIPRDQRSMLGQYQVMTDGPGRVLSAVEQTPDNPQKWMLETDIADIPDSKGLAFTLLHEYGHLLTLSPSQVPPDLQVFNHPYSDRAAERARAACATYFPGQGCSLPDSYLNKFFARFWKDLYDEWNTIARLPDNSRRDSQLESFYRKYRDRFVDSYAVTSPSEDIAETWAFYILETRPQGESIMDRKVAFFYDFPELVSLRDSIVQSLCTVDP